MNAVGTSRGGSGEKSRAPKPPTPANRLFEHDRRARTLLYLAVAAGFGAGALFVVQAVLLSGAVNRVFRLEQTLADVLPLLGLMLALLVLRAGLIGTQEALAQRSASRVKGSLRSRLLARLYELGPAYTQSERSGELVNTAVEGIEALDAYITQYVPARTLAVLVPLLVLLAVFLIDPWTTLVLIFTGPMLLLLLALIGGRTKAITERRFLELSWLSAFFLDILQGLTTLKLFGRSREQAATIGEISQHYGKTTMEVLATAFQTSLMMEWAATAATAMVALEASLRLMNGAIGFDQALAVLLLTPEFFLPLRQMAVKYHMGTAGKAAAERVFALLDEGRGAEGTGGTQGTGATRDAQAGPPGMVPNLLTEHADRYDVCFADVCYAYPPQLRSWHPSERAPTSDGESRAALHGFSCTIPHGKTTALVGASGAGKTTAATLLLRFIDPASGRITVGGVDLLAWDRAAWRQLVAWAPQLPHLFHGSALDNIRLARPDAGLDQVIAAARAAHAHDFIQALPQGYDTPLGEGGARLSGGQRQRLALARAFLKDAPVLLLDEATANLDAHSEALIRDALARLVAGRTVLLIAHRLELAYSADQIIVMDAGRAVETGTHTELLVQNGLYTRLVASYTAGN
jgi:thiol reductant ABC exporter CydD subunit